jgi:hypothetical protein
MKITKFRNFSLFLVAVTMSGLVAPLSMHAATKKLDLYNPNKRYGDEHVVITNASSKCVTKKSIASHATNLQRAEKDGLTFNVNSTTEGELGDAYRKYLDGLDLIWDAMNEPYCGFGAFGVTAAYRSYDKSVNHTRDRFLTAAKKLGAIAKKLNVKETTVAAAKTTSP